MATTNADYRQQAIDALDKARAYAINSPARAVRLAEAQVLALLALDAPQPPKADVVFPEAPAAEDTADDTPAPARKRRTRKSAPAKPEADADAEAVQ